jgi:acyl-CoA thioesterase I
LPIELIIMTDYLWDSDIVHKEPFFLFQENESIPLHFLRVPKRILKIENLYQGLDLVHKLDFNIDISAQSTSFIEIPPSSQISKDVVDISAIYRPHDSPNSYKQAKDRDISLLFSEEGLFHKQQISVTYEPADAHNILREIIEENGRKVKNHLPHFHRKLKEKKQPGIFLFGDSISAGANASKLFPIPLNPMQDAFGPLVVDLLSQSHPDCQFVFKNESVGGQSSPWGAKYLADKLGPILKQFPDYGPDLIIFGWGMNDSSGKRSPKKFIKNLQKQMKIAKKINPDCEFIILNSTIPNKLWHAAHIDYVLKYQIALWDLYEKENSKGKGSSFIIADLTAIWKHLIEKKRYYDITGNGLNHPNDFGHRIIAEVIHYLISASFSNV